MFNKIIGEKHFSRAGWRQAVVCVICLSLWVGLMVMAVGCGDNGSAVIMIGETTGSENATHESLAIESREDHGESDQEETNALIYVHVSGQVVNPGVYLLAEGSRVWDAVEAAGGFLPEAAEDAVNLAMKVADGSKVTIPARQQVNEAGFSWYETDGGGFDDAAGLIDINRADVTALMTIPGIGQTRAEAIVSHREAQGSFGSIEEIMEVTGIKEGLFAKIKEYITVGG